MFSDEDISFMKRRRLDIGQLDEMLLKAVVNGGGHLAGQDGFVSDLVLVDDPVFSNVIKPSTDGGRDNAGWTEDDVEDGDEGLQLDF